MNWHHRIWTVTFCSEHYPTSMKNIINKISDALILFQPDETTEQIPTQEDIFLKEDDLSSTVNFQEKNTVLFTVYPPL